jgi:hypothetical protein
MINSDQKIKKSFNQILTDEKLTKFEPKKKTLRDSN